MPKRLTAMTLSLFLLLAIWSAVALAEGKGPLPALRPLAANGLPQISPADRCPVCGMFPAGHPANAAAMKLVDGRHFYFCGNGCLLRAFRHSRRYLGIGPEEIERMVVLSYFSGIALDARRAWWVKGSDVVGPMGPALVTIEDEKAVKIFQERHGGDMVFRLDDLDEVQWKQILPEKH
jgi:copper chaperone NosL